MRRVTRLHRGTRTATQTLAAVISIGILAVVGAGCGRVGTTARVSARSVDFGRFAGYAQLGPIVRSVSATITVPQAVTTGVEQPAAASTWVGAEALPVTSGAPFIQVGIAEIPDGPNPKIALYDVSWCAGTAHYCPPSQLFFVHAGDKLSVSLTLSHRHWTIVVTDGPKRRRIVTAEEGTNRFQLALRSQEDLAYNHPKWMVYPRVTGLRLSDLAVNGHAPQRQYLNPVWMSADTVPSPAGDTVIEPSALNNDAFTLLPGQATIPASVVRTLEKLSRSSGHIYRAQMQVADATVKTPGAKLADWASQISKALISYEDTLRRQRWPRDARANVSALLSTLRAQLELTQDSLRPSTSTLKGWQARLNASSASIEVANARLLHAVRLPWDALPVALSGTPARDARMTVGVANTRATAICAADQQNLARKVGLGLNVFRLTAGQAAWLFDDTATATRRIDQALGKLPVPASFRGRLAAFIAANSKTFGVASEIARTFAARPVSRRISAYTWVSEFGTLYDAGEPARRIAADDDIPALCVVVP